MRSRTLPLIVLVVAGSLLVVSVGWASARGDDGSCPIDGWMRATSVSARSGRGVPVQGMSAARRQAQRFADRLDLRAAEVMRFSGNYYVELEERDGRLATEVLVDPRTGSVKLEYGPAMMWNTRYGMMTGLGRSGSSGMMGGGTGMMGGSSEMMGGGTGMMGGGAPSAPAAGVVTATEARAIAQRWLARNTDDRSTVGAADTFPGYFTLHAMRGGRVTGMLSVNATTRAVWFHWWHGRFVAMSE